MFKNTRPHSSSMLRGHHLSSFENNRQAHSLEKISMTPIQNQDENRNSQDMPQPQNVFYHEETERNIRYSRRSQIRYVGVQETPQIQSQELSSWMQQSNSRQQGPAVFPHFQAEISGKRIELKQKIISLIKKYVQKVPIYQYNYAKLFGFAEQLFVLLSRQLKKEFQLQVTHQGNGISEEDFQGLKPQFVRTTLLKLKFILGRGARIPSSQCQNGWLFFSIVSKLDFQNLIQLMVNQAKWKSLSEQNYPLKRLGFLEDMQKQQQRLIWDIDITERYKQRYSKTLKILRDTKDQFEETLMLMFGQTQPAVLKILWRARPVLQQIP